MRKLAGHESTPWWHSNLSTPAPRKPFVGDAGRDNQIGLKNRRFEPVTAGMERLLATHIGL